MDNIAGEPLLNLRILYEDAIKLTVKKFANKHKMNLEDAKYYKKLLFNHLTTYVR